MFVNATSESSVPFYSQYIYEAILKNVNSDIKFKTKTVPFPVFYFFESRAAVGQSLDYAVIVSIALALIPCVIVAYIIKEREQQVKHMQVISGVSMSAYWWSNLISDIIKCYVPVAFILLLNYCFALNYEGVYILLLLYPLAIVPWTYLTSYLF